MQEEESVSLEVVCVCCGIGFPNGLAQAARMRMVGQALLLAGARFKVYHIGGSEFENNGPEGRADGIDYCYFPGATRRPVNPLHRKLSYISGAVKMMQRLRKERKSGAELCIYLWVTGGFLSLVLLSGFRLLKIPVVLEVNEWWPGRMNEFYRRCAHRLSDGSLPISTEIEQRLISWDGYRQHPRKIYRLPVLIDTEAWAPQESVPPVQSPYYLWCGNVDASEQDVRFILNAFSLAQKREPEIKLLFCGRTSSEMKQRIHNWADESGLSQAQVCLPGYVTESELKDFMRHATGLLLPLWQEERSFCRFPTKLGEYLASSAPVVSSKTGDVGRFLDDGVSALLNEPGDGAGFAKSLVDLASDTKKAEQIGAAGRRVAKEKLDFRVHQEALYNCFSSCIKKG